jgi:hypothetical protein
MDTVKIRLTRVFVTILIIYYKVSATNINLALFTGMLDRVKGLPWNKSLKPTVTRVTPFAEMANPAPRYGGLVPPFRCNIVY